MSSVAHSSAPPASATSPSTSSGSWTAGDRTAAAPDAGTYLPFIAPFLAGTRGRLRGRTIEYIVLNPSGGRGTYVAPWSMVSEFAAPTLHDIVLVRRLAALPRLTVNSVGDAARAVAREGYAGRPAAAAAAGAQAAINAAKLKICMTLMMSLGQRAGLSDRSRTGSGLDAETLDTGGLTAFASQIGWDQATLSSALEQLSTAFAGLGSRSAPGRVQRMLDLLGRVRDGLSAELSHRPVVGSGIQDAGQNDMSRRLTLTSILGRLDQTVAEVRRRLPDAQAALADPAALLDRWRRDAVSAIEPAVMLDAALEGWDRICLLWLDAETLSARLALLPELALLSRTSGSSAAAIGGDAPRPAPGSGPEAPAIGPNASPASGSAASLNQRIDVPLLVLVARNERIRAAEFAIENGPPLADTIHADG